MAIPKALAKTLSPSSPKLHTVKPTVAACDPTLLWLVHATNARRLQSILSDGYIDPRAKRRMHTDGKRVFMQVLAPSVVPRRCRARFWNTVVLVFRPCVLRGQRGTYGQIGSFDRPDSRRK
jgi:hypothetical protein